LGVDSAKLWGACLPMHLGTVDDECFAGSEGRDWYAYWRLLFAQIHESDIVNFETNYKGTFAIRFEL